MNKIIPSILLLTFLLGCTSQPKESQTLTPQVMGSLTLTSSAFGHNASIPNKYTCEGQDLSPPLDISGVPQNTQSLALIVDDPDAPVGTWDHWIVWNINPETARIEEGQMPQGALEGMNDFKKNPYGGPCPPPGKPHRYFFKLYALDTTLNLPTGSTKEEIEKTIEGHILDKAELVGIYERI